MPERAQPDGATARLVAFLAAAPAEPVRGAPTADDPALAPVLALADRDPIVRALLDTYLDGKLFALFDIEMHAGVLLRGKRGEPWNPDGQVIGAADVVVAKNGAGDVHVWSAETGEVRFLVHDEGWVARRTCSSIDRFVSQALEDCLDCLDADELAEPDAVDERHRRHLALAIEIAGADAVNEDARDALIRLGVLSDEPD